MKKELLVGSLLLMNPVAQATIADFHRAQMKTAHLNQDLAKMIFRSPVVEHELSYYDSDLDQWMQNRRVRFYVQLEFETSNEEVVVLDHADSSLMEFTARAHIFRASDEKRLGEYGESNYVRRIDENSFQIYECGSTATCWSGHSTSKMHVLTDSVTGGKFLVINNGSKVWWDFPKIRRFDLIK